MRLDVDLLKKKTDVKSCKALNFKKLIHENADNVLTIILTQILEEMNFNSKNDASEIENAAHMKTHIMLTVKSDLRILESD